MLPLLPELDTTLRELDSSDLMNQVSNYNEELQQNIISYLKTFGVVEKKAFVIAKKHLGTSFHILKSTGYQEWKKTLTTVAKS
jgi:hypothetical protein|uniref:Uncharacterized protein n=1 Tax=viral metagenome TaxID=1070528 RepID=A0A6C0CU73_9ZZZZ